VQPFTTVSRGLARAKSHFVPFRSRSRQIVAGLACLSMAGSGGLALAVASAPSAAATPAPGGPAFSCTSATDFYSIDDTLYQSPETSGAPAFVPVGTATQDYNASMRTTTILSRSTVLVA